MIIYFAYIHLQYRVDTHGYPFCQVAFDDLIEAALLIKAALENADEFMGDV